MVDHTADNIETLAQQVVEDMELDDLLAYAVQQMENHYLNDEESFIEDWNMRMEHE